MGEQNPLELQKDEAKTIFSLFELLHIGCYYKITFRKKGYSRDQEKYIYVTGKSDLEIILLDEEFEIYQMKNTDVETLFFTQISEDLYFSIIEKYCQNELEEIERKFDKTKIKIQNSRKFISERSFMGKLKKFLKGELNF